ncbi:dihydrolipoyl dehydrogenase family protein [Alienimonas chondri]|uniref:Glutathione amide reductase n=1 Tax=Alienimonas chondri TaxID=2681879 RepID=A0ABX1VG92_9PLAN|nr:NAD(P)/FAD-dependent oxidoreductase [Alienimonas chondri]NNJ27148.1 Glutathione amide reductase [Alienimonas chondri]
MSETPPDSASPAAERRYDVVVIGSGPAAGTVVSGLKDSGKRVAAVDRRRFGGTCALRGCNPKKVLLNAAKVVDAARRSHGVMVEGGNTVDIDWPRLHAFQTSFTDPVPPSRVDQFREAGADCFAGNARFTAADTLVVEPWDVPGGDVPAGDVPGGEVPAGEGGAAPITLRFEQVVIATGSIPVPIDVPGKERLTLSDQFLDVADVPERIVFIGGGYISLEFAHALLRADREVTILEATPHILDPFDHVLADRLADRTRGLGARIECGVKLTAIEDAPDGSLIAVAERENGADGETLRISCDAVVHGAGRTPAVESLACDAAGIDCDEQGVTVTDELVSTSNSRVFAAGDCAGLGHPMLTPVAEAHGDAVVQAILTGTPAAPNVSPLPSAAFTEPELAAVGLTAKEAEEQGVAFDLLEADIGTKGALRKRCEPCAGYRLLLEPKTGKLLGAHLLGPDMAELINLFAVAMKHGLTLADLVAVPLTYPSLAAEILQDAFDQAEQSASTGASKAGLS